jgi:putative ergosteryl-3beta-O-L-aspartate hydrolase
MSRLVLNLRAYFLRPIYRLLVFLDRHLSAPRPASHSFSISVPSTISKAPGSINLLFYTPPSYPKRPYWFSSPKAETTKEKYPLLINFHGGGFCIGNAADNARFAGEVTRNTGAIVVSVEYRLAPEHPYPTAIEDGVSAILYLWEHAEEYHLDVSRTSLSGFSAGGCLSFTTALRLYELRLQSQDSEGLPENNSLSSLSSLPANASLRSIVVFYPGVDYTMTRAQRNASNSEIVSPVSDATYKFFDDSYLHPPPTDLSYPLLSPALAPDEMLKNAFPTHMVLITCKGDPLLAEGEVFRERLKAAGKTVTGWAIPGVGHGFDSVVLGKKADDRRTKRDQAYRIAVEGLKEAWDIQGKGS